MSTKEVEVYSLEEFKITMGDSERNRLDSACGTDVPVLVEFDFDHGSKSSDIEPQIYRMKVKVSGGATLRTERACITLWDGFDCTNYLTAAQETKVECEMYRRMSERAQAANDEARIDGAIAARADRSWLAGYA